MIEDNNHSKIFVSENNRYYIKCDNKSIYVKILNEFKDIKKYYGINVYYKINEITDNYYKIDKPSIIRNCTILLIIRNNFDDSYNVDGYDYFNNDVDGYHYFDEDYGEYDYYDDDYDYDDDYYKYYFDYNYNY